MVQLDDEASSSASFEDIGGTPFKDSSADKEMVILDPHSKAQRYTKTETVPDVRYVLRYKGITGCVVECECMLFQAPKCKEVEDKYSC